MADEQDNDQEKTEEPSQQRIDDYRKKGDVASSKELTSVFLLTASFLVLTLSSVYMFETLSNLLHWIYSQDVRTAYTQKSLITISYRVALDLAKCLAPILLTTASVGVFMNVVQVGFLYSPEVLEFKPERLNPISGFKRLISIRSIVEALKGILKFIFILSIIYFFMKNKLNSFQGFFHTEIWQSFMVAKDIIGELSISIILSLMAIAIGDFGYQKYSYRKKIMMTKEEVRREHKEQDGNPELKQKIKSIQSEMAHKRTMEEVKKADVIITNPTHLSIAVKYDPQTMAAPIVLAKGADNLAMQMRKVARSKNIPLVENVPLARALFKTVKDGHAIPRDLYKAIAEVLAFVYKLKKKSKALV